MMSNVIEELKGIRLTLEPDLRKSLERIQAEQTQKLGKKASLANILQHYARVGLKAELTPREDLEAISKKAHKHKKKYKAALEELEKANAKLAALEHKLESGLLVPYPLVWAMAATAGMAGWKYFELNEQNREHAHALGAMVKQMLTGKDKEQALEWLSANAAQLPPPLVSSLKNMIDSPSAPASSAKASLATANSTLANPSYA